MATFLEMVLISGLISIGWYTWDWLWRKLVEDLSRDSYEALMIVSVLQCLLTVIFYLLSSSRDSQYDKNSLLEAAYMILGAGYFIHDTPHWEPTATLNSISYLVHHVISFFGIIMVLNYGCGGSYLLNIAVLMEASTPVLLIRYYQKEACCDTRLTEVTYAVLFAVLRVWYGSKLILRIAADSQVPLHLKLVTALFWLSNVAMFPSVLEMALPRSTLLCSTVAQMAAGVRMVAAAGGDIIQGMCGGKTKGLCASPRSQYLRRRRSSRSR